jgi:hypothetical protein
MCVLLAVVPNADCEGIASKMGSLGCCVQHDQFGEQLNCDDCLYCAQIFNSVQLRTVTRREARVHISMPSSTGQFRLTAGVRARVQCCPAQCGMFCVTRLRWSGHNRTHGIDRRRLEIDIAESTASSE